MKKVGDNISAERSSWSFSGDVVDNFDNHVSKSVPLYFEGHTLINGLSDFFIKDDSVVYEIGCSTGSLISKVAQHSNKASAKFIGIDIEKDMINFAKKNKQKKLKNLNFLCDDVTKLKFKMSDMIISYYTVQFIRPSLRQQLIDKIYQNLNWGGAFILFEKVRGADARFQDIFVTLYNEFKLQNGYTPDDIFAKSQSLKGVLEPFSSQANIDMLKRAGFIDICSIQKSLGFEGFLAIK
jgi:tRNA (cmo5U34)-methyltransferase